MRSYTLCEGGRALGIAFGILLIAGLVLVGTSKAQIPPPSSGGGSSGGGGTVPTEEWNKTFGGLDLDIVYSVQQTSDEGYILAGGTKSYGSGDYDAWLIKTDGNGYQQWNRTFGGASYEQAHSIQQTSDEGYILGGWTASFGNGSEDAWLIKTDKNGNQQWNKTFGGTSADGAQFIQQTSDGGYIFAGATWSYGSGYNDVWLVKTDANGNQQWNRTFGGTNFDYANSVQQTSDGGYILTGLTMSYGAGNADAWLVKTDANGNELWNMTFGGINDDTAASVKQTSDGGYILVGYTSSYGDGYRDAWLIKADENGNEQWNKTFGGTSADEAYSVQQTSDGGYILTGLTMSYGAGNGDAWLIRTDANGNQMWNMTFGGTGYDEADYVQQTSNGGYILAGYTSSFGSGMADAWLIKISNTSIPPTTGAPNITSFNPPTSTVTNKVSDSRTFNIVANQTVNVSWQINGTVVFNETGVTTSSYTNTSAAQGTWNVNVVANNANGTAIQTWVWIVTSVPTAGSISGFKINDTNGNGKWDQGETGLANWEISLTDNQGKTITNTTDSNGNYFFGGLAAGTYTVAEIPQGGWTQTFPTGTYTVVLATDQHVTGKNFLNHRSEIPIPEFPSLGLIIPFAGIFSLVLVLLRRRDK